MKPHTPGPWHVRPRNGPGGITAEVCYGKDTECITDGVYETSDAHLMAAAPELLEALKEVMTWIKNWEPRFSESSAWDITEASVSAAISKTEGEIVR